MRPMHDLPPLTHHEILARVGPFTRRGHSVDLGASDRARREIAFRPLEHPAAGGLPPLRETLRLDLTEPERPRLTRELLAPDGMKASLQAEGADAGLLLEDIMAVPPARQLQRVDGCLIAMHHRLNGRTLLLREAEARLPGLTLRMTVTGVSGYPAEIELLPAPGTTPEFPSDLLAVQGGAWGRLTAVQRGWLGSVMLRGADARRSDDAQALLTRCVTHLRQTLSEPPERFHGRHRGARWRLTVREMLPMSVGLGVVALALELQRQGPERASVLALLANVAPPLLMMLYFLRREMPHIGLPRVPRRLPASAWQAVPPGDPTP